MKEKISYIVAGFLLVGFIVMWFFNLSFSLPTTFKAMVEKQISQDKDTSLDTNKIHSVRIEIPYTSKPDVSEIDNKDVISALLSNELRIYKGGRIKESDEEYDLYVHLYGSGSTHRYTVSESYIRTFDGIYKVLDKENDLFEYIKYLYEEE